MEVSYVTHRGIPRAITCPPGEGSHNIDGSQYHEPDWVGRGRGGGVGPVEACPSGGGPHGIVQNPGFVVVGTHVEVCL
jgi:hypothetical protein